MYASIYVRLRCARLEGLSLQHNQFNAGFLEPLAKRIGIVATFGHDLLRLVPPLAFRLTSADFGEGASAPRHPLKGDCSPDYRLRERWLLSSSPERYLGVVSRDECLNLRRIVRELTPGP